MLNCLEWPDVRFLGMNFLMACGWIIPLIVWVICWFAGKKFPCVMWYHNEMTPFLAKGYWFCDFDRNQRFAMRTKLGCFIEFPKLLPVFISYFRSIKLNHFWLDIDKHPKFSWIMLSVSSFVIVCSGFGMIINEKLADLCTTFRNTICIEPMG